VKENGGHGTHYTGGRFIFDDEFHGLRKILGMPTTEQGICDEWNRDHRGMKKIPA
jgi:hypothetical protein